MCKFFGSKSVLVLNHSQYLDLTPCDYFLSLKLKMNLKGKQFDTILDIQKISDRGHVDHLRRKLSVKFSKVIRLL